MSTVFPPPAGSRHRAVVLVHGAWAGEWSWVPVLPLLRASGRPAHAVSLTGLGSRRHQGGPTVTLADHVADVVGLVETLDLTAVTLVGHSYGGRVVTGACARLAERVDAVVFLDAHAPVGEDPGVPAAWIEAAEANGGMLPFTAYDPDPALLGGPEGLAWFRARLAPMPMACFTAPWRVDLPDDVARTYVAATADRPSRFEGYARACRADPGWRYAEIDGPHWLMFSHPERVAEILLAA